MPTREPTIKFDVSDVDPEEAFQGSEPPKPGVYTAKVKEVSAGYSKGDDGKPDKTRQRLEVVLEITSKDYKGYPLWDYISTTSEGHKRKLAAFLQLMGIATNSTREGSFKPSQCVGKTLKVRLRADTDQDGGYRPKVAALLPMDSEAGEEGSEVESGDGSEPEPEPEPETGDGSGYTREELEELYSDTDALANIAKDEFGINPDEIETWELVVDAILEAQEAGGGPETNDTSSENGDGGGDHPEEDGYDDLEIGALKAELKERGLATGGVKAALIKRLRENDANGPW